jgi:GNAT superfamily N-acetyltransferase
MSNSASDSRPAGRAASGNDPVEARSGVPQRTVLEDCSGSPVRREASKSVRSRPVRRPGSSHSHSDPPPCSTSLHQERATLAVRELTRSDEAAVDTVFAGLSPNSRYFRFHTGSDRLVETVRRSLTDVDGHDRIGMIAEVATSGGWKPVGMAHLYRVGEHWGEVAVMVVDAWHRHGIGRQLLYALSERAVELGFQEVHARVVLENDAVLRLAHHLFPGVLSWWRGDVVELRYLISGTWNWDEAFSSSLKCG